MVRDELHGMRHEFRSSNIGYIGAMGVWLTICEWYECGMVPALPRTIRRRARPANVGGQRDHGTTNRGYCMQ